MILEKGTHSLCDDCFRTVAPYSRRHVLDPVRSPQPTAIPCCNCRVVHNSGIFVRRDPSMLPCKGEHGAP
jgi:hypothetical protein